jgi:hypothetical protein
MTKLESPLKNYSIESLRLKLAKEAADAGLSYANFYFIKCDNHFRAVAEMLSETQTDQSAFVYAMQ